MLVQHWGEKQDDYLYDETLSDKVSVFLEHTKALTIVGGKMSCTLTHGLSFIINKLNSKVNQNIWCIKTHLKNKNNYNINIIFQLFIIW